MPGLGKVSQSDLYHVGVARPECPLPDTFRVFGFPARLVVEGKGTLEIAVADTAECFTLATVLNPTQSFTITGGSGLYAGASGGGSVMHQARFSPTGARGYDTWTGTLVVPGVGFDVTAPVLSGAKPKTVLAPPRAKSARVRFTVTAQDTVDGSVPVTCQPRSGSRFKLGKTRVACATTDRSANTATTKFTITVKARR